MMRVASWMLTSTREPGLEEVMSCSFYGAGGAGKVAHDFLQGIVFYFGLGGIADFRFLCVLSSFMLHE